MMLVQSQAYREQYGFNSIFLLPVNLYGPNDNFSFKSSHVIPALIRKFYLANLLSQGKYDLIIKDFLRNGDNKALIGEAKIEIDKNTSKEDILTLLEYYGIKQDHQNVEHVASNIEQSVSVEIWGTGKATREFFYVEDAAQAIVAATEKYDKSEPVNIGAGFEISIRDLTELIVELTDYRGKVARNYNQPDGQPRRMLDTTRAYEEFGFRSKTDFRDGLKTTIAWYADFSKNIVIES
jgi:GDP-L-fucose synthase